MKDGSQRRRILAPVHHHINEGNLIRIPNTYGGNHCLFMALQASMVQHTQGMPKRMFYDYINSMNSQRGVLT